MYDYDSNAFDHVQDGVQRLASAWSDQGEYCGYLRMEIDTDGEFRLFDADGVEITEGECFVSPMKRLFIIDQVDTHLPTPWGALITCSELIPDTDFDLPEDPTEDVGRSGELGEMLQAIKNSKEFNATAQEADTD